MKLETRTTRKFIELKVDEIETTIFKDNESEMNEMIINLIEVVIDMSSYTDKDIEEHIADYFN